jgi:hypothetical protein
MAIIWDKGFTSELLTEPAKIEAPKPKETIDDLKEQKEAPKPEQKGLGR